MVLCLIEGKIIWHMFCVTYIAMSKILIVDDEKLFLKILVEGLKNRREMEDIDILTAYNGRVAMDILQSNPDVDLVLTDLRMPEVDGFQLISHMIKKHPNIPIIVMTAYGSRELEKTIEEKGIFHYIEKPIDFDELVEKVSSKLSAKQRGSLKGFKLSTLLQIMEMDMLSCTLYVSFEGRTGTLYIKEGQVVNARLGDLEPEEAAMEIIGWEGGEIDIKEPDGDVEEAISVGLMNLLLEAFRKKDEKGALAEAQAAEGVVLKSQEGDLGTTQSKVKEVEEMKLEKLNEAIEVLKDDLGNGLLATDIFSSKDGQPIAGWNSQPAASALFSQITKMMNKALKDAGFPSLNQYYLLNLEGNKVVLVMYMNEFQWGVLMDSEKVPLGMLINVAMPKALKTFREAMSG
jgi:CheY-like chemotaxis protein